MSLDSDIKKVIIQLRKYGKEAEQGIADVTEFTARSIELNAKNIVPTDLGKLGQSILATEKSKTEWEISAGGLIAPYAPYVEFGTGALVSVPPEWKEIAIRFKGKGIKQVNLLPHPYMYPSYIKGKQEYLKKLKLLLKKYGNTK